MLNSRENSSVCRLQFSEKSLQFSVRSLLFSEKGLQIPVRWPLGGTWVGDRHFCKLLIYNKIRFGWERWHLCVILYSEMYYIRRHIRVRSSLGSAPSRKASTDLVSMSMTWWALRDPAWAISCISRSSPNCSSAGFMASFRPSV